MLADFNTSFIELIAKQTGKQLPAVSDSYPDKWTYHRTTVTAEEEPKLWDTIKKSLFWAKLLPMPKALETLEQLREMREHGHHIYFITTRSGDFAKQLSENWLRYHGMTNPTVLIADSETAKGQLAAALGLDVFLDDKPENCREVEIETWDQINERSRCRVILIDAPWNRHATNFERARTALEALERVMLQAENLRVAA